LKSGADFYGMIGRSRAMRQVFERIERFARSPVPVLILGETGTGKDMAARAIGQIAGPHRPFVALNCAAIPETLIESELFGHERGAFTGAIRRRTGIIAQANGGILFLDEIGELPVHTQAKLLRVIETGEYRPIGGERVLHSRFRVIAATNRDVDQLVARERFRLDLLHRLGAARVVMPMLSEHLEDLPALAEEFLRQFRGGNGGAGPTRLTAGALHILRSADWPGNVRQLRNVIEAAASTVSGEVIEEEHIAEIVQMNLPQARERVAPASLAETLRQTEAMAIRHALQQAGGDWRKAAALLRISRATLYRKLKVLNGAPGR